jgi:23S rRNA (guanosine2251-2'-O)-methyltransferase
MSERSSSDRRPDAGASGYRRPQGGDPRSRRPATPGDRAPRGRVGDVSPRATRLIPREYDIVYGKHSVRAVFAARPGDVKRVVMREGAARYLQEFVDLATSHGIEPELVRTGEFLRLSGLSTDDKHQGIFLVTNPLRIYTEHDFDLLNNASRVVVLDQISNPQNFGTIVRTAAFFHMDAVVWLKEGAVDVNETVTRVAVGGTEFVRLFRVTNLANTLQQLKQRGFWVYGFDEHGDSSLSTTTFDGKSVLIIGAENEGMRRLTKELCDVIVRIPGGQSGLGSLNAAVAAGIVMSQAWQPPTD